jgi:hypothetical protein
MRRRRDDNAKKVWISLFIIAVMVLGTFGFIAGYQSSDNSNTDYNGFSFRQLDNQQWETEVNDRDYSFYFHPSQLVLFVPTSIVNTIETTPQITLTFDPTVNELQYVELSRFSFGQFLINQGKFVQHAVTSASDEYPLLPVQTCSPEGDEVYVTFAAGNESVASIDGNCITLTAQNPAQYIGFTEKIEYMMLGII